ncbi:MAG: DUF1576 domain-containing protein, partial [Pseudoflavonifractor sp.]
MWCPPPSAGEGSRSIVAVYVCSALCRCIVGTGLCPGPRPHKRGGEPIRYRKLYSGLLIFAAGLLAIGLIFGDFRSIPAGLWKIITTEDTLITDYIQIAGIGAAFTNSALVTAISILILRLTDDTPNGYTLVVVGLMAGFALFGKNIVNIWPILCGTLLYARLQGEPFGKHATVGLLSTALAPVGSFIALGGHWLSP